MFYLIFDLEIGWFFPTFKQCFLILMIYVSFFMSMISVSGGKEKKPGKRKYYRFFFFSLAWCRRFNANMSFESCDNWVVKGSTWRNWHFDWDCVTFGNLVRFTWSRNLYKILRRHRKQFFNVSLVAIQKFLFDLNSKVMRIIEKFFFPFYI